MVLQLVETYCLETIIGHELVPVYYIERSDTDLDHISRRAYQEKTAILNIFN